MEAGRELDALVAEQVMGWQWFDSSDRAVRYFRPPDIFRYGAIAEGGLTEYTDQLPRYSTDIGAAWEVIEALARGKRNMAVTVSNLGTPHATVLEGVGGVKERRWDAWIDSIDIPDPRPHSVRCALAICLAALEAINAAV